MVLGYEGKSTSVQTSIKRSFRSRYLAKEGSIAQKMNGGNHACFGFRSREGGIGEVTCGCGLRNGTSTDPPGMKGSTDVYATDFNLSCYGSVVVL